MYKYFVALSFLLLSITCSTDGQEPTGQCSRFECEYKIIERLVKLEIARDTLGKKVDELEAANHAKSQQIDEMKNELAGIKTRKTAIALKVRLSKDVTLSVGQRLMYDNVVVNVGNSFDRVSGCFRAPSNGTYLFSVTACSKGNDWGVLNIVNDEKVLGQVRSGNDGGYYDCNSEVAVGYMEVGSQVWIEMLEGGNGVQNTYHWNSFTAALVH